MKSKYNEAMSSFVRHFDGDEISLPLSDRAISTTKEAINPINFASGVVPSNLNSSSSTIAKNNAREFQGPFRWKLCRIFVREDCEQFPRNCLSPGPVNDSGNIVIVVVENVAIAEVRMTQNELVVSV